jgi:hypothetical protein
MLIDSMLCDAYIGLSYVMYLHRLAFQKARCPQSQIRLRQAMPSHCVVCSEVLKQSGCK